MADYLSDDVVPGRNTGLRDIDGEELFDGDMVVNFNFPEPNSGPVQVRFTYRGKYSFWTAGGASIQTLSASPRFGVRKVRS